MISNFPTEMCGNVIKSDGKQVFNGLTERPKVRKKKNAYVTEMQKTKTCVSFPTNIFCLFQGQDQNLCQKHSNNLLLSSHIVIIKSQH